LAYQINDLMLGFPCWCSVCCYVLFQLCHFT